MSNRRVEISREVMFDIANKFDRMADVLLLPSGSKHLHKILLGAAGAAADSHIKHPTPSHVFLDAVVCLNNDALIPLTFECAVIPLNGSNDMYSVLGAYARNTIRNLQAEPTDVEEH